MKNEKFSILNSQFLILFVIAALVLASCSSKKSDTYSIGSYYEKDGVKGIVYKVNADGEHGMIVSLNETACAWSTERIVTGCALTDNGMNNMIIIKAKPDWGTKYPAFKWCDDLNKDGITGWYLPAKDELAQLYAGYCGLSSFPGKEDDAATKYAAARTKFNVALVAHGGVVMSENSWYWSSTEYYSGGRAWRLDLKNGNLSDSDGDKTLNFKVRAVRAF